MSRKGRRDCRVGDRKKNAMNQRVEALQQSIRKQKKEAATAKKAAAIAAEEASSSLTPAAAAFLAQMRADVAAQLGTVATAAKPAPKKSAA